MYVLIFLSYYSINLWIPLSFLKTLYYVLFSFALPRRMIKRACLLNVLYYISKSWLVWFFACSFCSAVYLKKNWINNQNLWKNLILTLGFGIDCYLIISVHFFGQIIVSKYDIKSMSDCTYKKGVISSICPLLI